MPEHFSGDTVSAEFWCGKCQKPTQHRIDGNRKGPCLECIARLEREHRDRVEQAKQGDLF